MFGTEAAEGKGWTYTEGWVEGDVVWSDVGKRRSEGTRVVFSAIPLSGVDLLGVEKRP